MFYKKLAALERWRATAEPLPLGSGPFTCSAYFKAKSTNIERSSISWDHRFSQESRLQVTSDLKIASRGVGSSGPSNTIHLGAGRPATQYFPWTSIITSAVSVDPGKHHQHLCEMSCVKKDVTYDLDIAMNYGFPAGSPQLLRYVTEHTELIHNPPYVDWSCCVTCGNTSALDIALRLFCDPGDWILAEEYTYPRTIATAKAHGLNIMWVKVDDGGLCADDLEQKLKLWDLRSGPKPFVLYMIPCGQNPTGTTQTEARRDRIYEIAQQRDLYILEDDPYYFLDLEFCPEVDKQASQRSSEAIDQFLSHLPRSFLSRDVSGRVLRMDSTSKILSPGLRLGWVTASSQVIDKFVAHSEGSVLAPSGPSQVMVYKLLDQTWGHEGLMLWLIHLSSEYRRRRDSLVQACRAYLPSTRRWVLPTTGMFLWIRVSHPIPVSSGDENPVMEWEHVIYRRFVEQGVIVSKGSWFALRESSLSHSSYRLSFATSSEEDMQVAIQRFAAALR